MTNPTITGTTTVDLGTVLSEDIQIVRRVPQFNLPATKTSQTITNGLLGAIRLITIQGIIKGTEAELDSFNDDMEAWCNTNVQSKRTYTDSLGNTYTVRNIDYVRLRNNEGPGRLLYNMTFLESA